MTEQTQTLAEKAANHPQALVLPHGAAVIPAPAGMALAEYDADGDPSRTHTVVALASWHGAEGTVVVPIVVSVSDRRLRLPHELAGRTRLIADGDTQPQRLRPLAGR